MLELANIVHKDLFMTYLILWSYQTQIQSKLQ